MRSAQTRNETLVRCIRQRSATHSGRPRSFHLLRESSANASPECSRMKSGKLADFMLPAIEEFEMQGSRRKMRCYRFQATDKSLPEPAALLLLIAGGNASSGFSRDSCAWRPASV